MKNVSFTKVCALSVATLFLSCSLQAFNISSTYNSAVSGVKNLLGMQVKAPVKFGSKQWFKNGLNKVAQTRVVNAITTKATRAGETLKAHPYIATVVAVAAIGSVVAYFASKSGKTTKKTRTAAH